MSNSYDLRGKSAIVTGGAKGIGRAIAEVAGATSDVVDFAQSSSIAVALKRLGSRDEVAELAAWLCTDASRFNTGAVFDMSGGRARY